jgi:TPR repeat protein
MHELFRVGWVLQQQRKIPEAVECYREARRNRDRCASFQLNCMESFGQDLPMNIDLIINWQSLKLTVEEFNCLYECYKDVNITSIKFNLGLLYMVMNQPELAVEYIKLAAKNDYSPASGALTNLYLFGYSTILEYNYQRAMKWAERSASNGWHWGQYFLGYLYYMVKQDDIALKWYKLSAKQGNMEALAMVGYIYDIEKQDGNQAIIYYEKAAKKGHHDAQYNAGLYYYKKQNYDRAVKWYRVASKHRDSRAQNNLGFLYDKQLNYRKAFKYYHKSASQNNAYGLFNTAQYYHYGIGIPKNYALALFYYRGAQEQGYRNVNFYIDHIMGYQDIIRNSLLVYDSEERLNYSWFRLFLQELNEKYGLYNWDDGLIRSWIMDGIVEYFGISHKKMKNIETWFEKMDIPIGIRVENNK